MKNSNKMYQGLLVAGIVAFAAPSFVQAQATGTGAGSGSSHGGVTPGSPSSSGSQSGMPSGMTGSRGTQSDTPNTNPNTSGMNNPDRTGDSSSSMSGMNQDTGSSANDKQLNSQIRQSLNADTSLAGVGNNVRLSTTNGQVTLQGSVTSEMEKRQIEQKVRQMRDVDNVRNDLRVVGSGIPAGTSPSPGTSMR